MFDSIPDNLPVIEDPKQPTVVPQPVSELDKGTMPEPLPVVMPTNAPTRINSDIFDYVPLDEETSAGINWKKWLSILVGAGLVGLVGWVIWFGKVPFVRTVIFNPPWQLSANKVAQYVIDDLLVADHVKFSAVLSAEKFKVILDDQVPQLSDVKADVKADVNFAPPYNSQLFLEVDHDGQNKSKLEYQVIRGQSYLGGQSSWEFLRQMFEVSGLAKIILPSQTSQPSLTFAEVKDIYRQHKFIIASDLEKSTIDGQDYAMVTLTTDPDLYQGFVQAIRDKKEVGLPFSNNLDMIFSPQTTVKAAVRLSDKSFRNAFVEGVHSRLGKYKLSISLESLDKKIIELTAPESVITTSAALEPPQEVEVTDKTIPESLRLLINSQTEIIKKLIGPDPQIPSEFPTDYNLDSDGDGMVDAIEILLGTLPSKADSDGDGYNDFLEINNGFNPLGEGKLQLVTSTSDIAF